MNRAQRIVLVAYCLSLAYCCVWIPWHVKADIRHGVQYVRVGYGWLWAGPYMNPPKVYNPPLKTGAGPEFDIAKEEDIPHPLFEKATPDLSLIGLRLVNATAIATAAILLVGLRVVS
jgi:hypothetical protein